MYEKEGEGKRGRVEEGGGEKRGRKGERGEGKGEKRREGERMRTNSIQTS